MKINGSLVFDASSASEIQNLRVQKYTGATVPAHGSDAANVGRLIYVTETGGGYTAGTIYIGGATSWVALATGGNAAALQTEVDALETSLGAIVGADGVFVPGQVTIGGAASTATDVTELLQELADYANANNELAELDDVDFTGGAPATDDLLRYNGTKWVSSSLSEAGVQAADAGLDALAAKTSTGIMVQTGADTFSSVTLVAPVAGITITNADGVSGNPTFALANDLAALEGLATTGYIVRTGDGTATTRSIVGTTDNIVVTNGSGVSSDTSINLATVTQAASGDFVKVTLDTFGRVTGNTAVVAADITALVDATYVNVSGDTMASAADLVFVGGGTVKGLPSPINDTDAVNKAYADALAAGLSWKQAVRAASTGNLTLSGTQTVDGVALVAGNRVLVKDQTDPAENGIYVVAAGAWTRATDMDAAAEFDGSAVFVQEGSTLQGSGWTETATVTTVGTDAVAFSQFTGGALYTWGVGLSNSGNTINVNLGAGIAQLPSDEVGIDLFNTTTGAIILTDDGSTRAGAPATNSKLHLLLDTTATGGLDQGSLGLFIKAAGVTNAMLVNQGVVTNADSGTNGALNLGGELEIKGTSTQGITTAIAGSVFTISASDASSSQKGVASFSSADFTVTAGDVALTASLDSLTNVSTADSATTGDLLQKSAGDWVAVDVATVVGGANLGDLADVGTAAPTTAKQALIADGSAWQAKSIYFTNTYSSSSTWTVTHNLGQQFVNVTVMAETGTPGEYEVVIPQSITMTSVNQLTVTFNTAVSGAVAVMGIA